MTKALQIRSIDLLKYTEDVVDKQPKESEIKKIVASYVESIHPTHIAIEVPLDDNADFLAHGHVPAPLTIDEFTRVWVDTIHKAGVNVYFRGTFCGIKNLYNFGFDKATPIGSFDTAIADGKATWLGRYYQWLNTHLSNMLPGDIIGVIPEATNNAFNGNFFIQSSNPLVNNVQGEFLNFYTDLKRITDAVTKSISPIYTGYSANAYNDITSGWIPAFLFDLIGIMSVDYYGDKQTPQEMEKALNDLYLEFRQPIFLSEWQIPTSSVLYPTVDNNPQEFFETFIRLRDKGILIGLNYFDGLDFNEGIFTNDDLNDKGHLLGAFFAQGGKPEPISVVKKEEKQEISQQKDDFSPENLNTQKWPVENKEPTPNITSVNQTTSKHLEIKPKPVKKKKTGIKPPKGQVFHGTGDGNYRLHKHDVPFLVRVGFYALIGANATELTNQLTHSSFANLTPYVMIGYTLLIAIGHAILDGK